MAESIELDFYLDADDSYAPRKLPQGIVKMGGVEYSVRCPKDSLPIMLGRIERRAHESKDPAEQEEIIRRLLEACFEEKDVPEILERVISPQERSFSIAFLVDTVQRVYQQYAAVLDEQYEELGVKNPVKQPADRLPSSRKQRPKALPSAKKTAAKKTARKTPAKKTSARG